MLQAPSQGLTARCSSSCADRTMRAVLQRPASRAFCAASRQRLAGAPLPLHAAPSQLTKSAQPQRARAPLSRRALRVCAGWGDPIDWTPAKITSSRPAADGMRRLTVDTGSIADGYKVPGQFVQVRVGDSKPGFFAIASPPDPNNQGVIELLVKALPDTASELIAQAEEGDIVDVSPVMGKGFSIDKLPADKYSTVLLFATGSGIAPVKALIESDELQVSERKSVKLYYGTRSEALTPFREEAAQWAASGVQLINVFSSEGKGYVQDVFAKEHANVNGAATGAVLCGQKQMCEQITQILVDAGVGKDDILLNF